jgi:hypothetical protein
MESCEPDLATPSLVHKWLLNETEPWSQGRQVVYNSEHVLYRKDLRNLVNEVGDSARPRLIVLMRNRRQGCRNAEENKPD